MRWINRAGALAMVAAVMIAGPAWAQAQVKMAVGKVNYTAPLPKGYCVPKTDEEVRRADYGASIDKENQTSLTLISCGDGAVGSDYMLVKTPYAMLSTEVTLNMVLGDPYFAAPRADEKAPGAEAALEGALSDTTGQKVDVNTAVSARGHDDVCGYIGGTISADIGGMHYVSLGGCMTVVGGRMITIFFYAEGQDPAIAKRLMAKARAFAVTIRAER